MIANEGESRRFSFIESTVMKDVVDSPLELTTEKKLNKKDF